MMYLGYGRPVGEPEWKAQDIAIEFDSLTRHKYSVGASGSGKSADLLDNIHQYVRAGHGFAIMELEEALAGPTLSYLAEANWPPEKVIYINPTAERVIPLNVLKPIEHPHTAIEDVVAAMKRAWWDSWGDRMHDYLKNALTVLQEVGLTLGELTRFISDVDFRGAVLKASGNEAAQNYFIHHLGTISASQYRLIVESSRNKASQFTENPFIRPMISAEECFDFKVAMDQGYAVIVDIPERLLKDSARLLAMLILARIQGAALQRR